MDSTFVDMYDIKLICRIFHLYVVHETSDMIITLCIRNVIIGCHKVLHLLALMINALSMIFHPLIFCHFETGARRMSNCPNSRFIETLFTQLMFEIWVCLFKSWASSPGLPQNVMSSCTPNYYNANSCLSLIWKPGCLCPHVRSAMPSLFFPSLKSCSHNAYSVMRLLVG